ncbi:MAG TPA: enoyl-CoA hydratase-related protein [Actinomycetota bacterium]|nr:enoyl-CoA hydratase-related protein [Actinomycetota bacterium]
MRLSADADLVRRERVDATLLLTFAREEKLNALSTSMLERLDDALDAAEHDDEVRVLVLTGAGAKAFVAGADIGEYAEQDHEAFVAYQALSRRVFSRLDASMKPAVAAVNGYALGGGFEIALCCDLIVASDRARFGLPEGLLGLVPGGGGTQRLTRAVGPFVAADVLLSARRLTAHEAHRLGLVAEVVPPEELREAALEKATAISAIAPLASREMLGLIRAAADVALEEGLTREQDALARLHRTDDAAEGVRAFVEKRPPRFRRA